MDKTIVIKLDASMANDLKENLNSEDFNKLVDITVDNQWVLSDEFVKGNIRLATIFTGLNKQYDRKNFTYILLWLLSGIAVYASIAILFNGIAFLGMMVTFGSFYMLSQLRYYDQRATNTKYIRTLILSLQHRCILANTELMFNELITHHDELADRVNILIDEKNQIQSTLNSESVYQDAFEKQKQYYSLLINFLYEKDRDLYKEFINSLSAHTVVQYLDGTLESSTVH